GRQRAGDGHRPRQPPLLGPGDPHLAGRALLSLVLLGPLPPRGRRVPAAPGQQGGQGKGRHQTVQELPRHGSPRSPRESGGGTDTYPLPKSYAPPLVFPPGGGDRGVTERHRGPERSDRGLNQPDLVPGGPDRGPDESDLVPKDPDRGPDV